MTKSPILESLFSVKKLELNDGEILAVVVLNEDCEIFKAHFPSDPITPGVCQLNLLKDLLYQAYPQKTFTLQTASQIKFVEALRPAKSREIQVQIQTTFTDESMSISSSIFDDKQIFLKAKINYAISEA
jgi:3-hydroxyacyl-[acyl-carrier-protein] dehydratase